MESLGVGQALRHLVVEARKEAIEEVPKRKGKVIVISGPTACGKSDFAMLLAKNMAGEIICGDSMQVYRGLDIGTAKPTIEDRLQIPHHLVDISEVSQPFTVVNFHEEATKAIDAILERKGVPIVVGGSGFYLHALAYGPPPGPAPDPYVRARLEVQMAEEGPKAMYDRLNDLDPGYAERITHHDRHKIVRALEIIQVTGRKVSSMPWKEGAVSAKYDFRCWFLTRPKDILYRRVDQRCQRMVEMGFLEEVEAMLPKGLMDNSAASQAIGYRQAIEYLSSSRRPEDYQHFMMKFAQASRHYVKRQFTWFRREPLYRWLDVDALDYENAMDLVVRDYERIL